jgi:hypothetical protein
VAVDVVFEVRRLLDVDYKEMRAGGVGTSLSDLCKKAIRTCGAEKEVDADELGVAFAWATAHDTQRRNK